MGTFPKWSTGNSYFDEEAWNLIVKQSERKVTGCAANTLKGWETRRKNTEARQRWHLETAVAGRFAEFQAENLRRGFARWHIMAQLEPGAWYAMADIVALSGVPKKTLEGTMNNRLIGEKLFEKVQNPDWIDRRLPNGFKVWLHPRWLYRLTEKGIAARSVARSELEARGWPIYAPDKKDAPAPS